MSSSFLPLATLALSVTCSCDSGGGKKQEKPVAAERKLAGVFPDRFTCDSIIKDQELASLLGAVKVSLVDSAIAPPRGLPRPCAYQVTLQTEMQGWTFDIDCRDNMKTTAEALFAQYRKTSADLVEQFDIAADAGIKPTDAGIVIKRPEDAVEVSVGAKALDHHGQGILFIDDDAPCYVRLVGPSAEKRLELAKVLSKNLTYMNAPMTPRAAPPGM